MKSSKSAVLALATVLGLSARAPAAQPRPVRLDPALRRQAIDHLVSQQSISSRGIESVLGRLGFSRYGHHPELQRPHHAAWPIVEGAIKAYVDHYRVDKRVAARRLFARFLEDPWAGAVRAHVVALVAAGVPERGRALRERAASEVGQQVFREQQRELGGDPKLDGLDPAIQATIGRLLLQGRQFDAMVLIASALSGKPVQDVQQAAPELRRGLAEQQIVAFDKKYHNRKELPHASWPVQLRAELAGWSPKRPKDRPLVSPEIVGRMQALLDWSERDTIEEIGRMLADGRGPLALATIRTAAGFDGWRHRPRPSQFADRLTKEISHLDLGWQSPFDARKSALAKRLGASVKELETLLGAMIVAGKRGEVLVLHTAAHLTAGPIAVGSQKVDRDPHQDRTPPAANENTQSAPAKPPRDPEPPPPSPAGQNPDPKYPQRLRALRPPAALDAYHFRVQTGAAQVHYYDAPNVNTLPRNGGSFPSGIDLAILETSRRYPGWCRVFGTFGGQTRTGWVEVKNLVGKSVKPDSVTAKVAMKPTHLWMAHQQPPIEWLDPGVKVVPRGKANIHYWVEVEYKNAKNHKVSGWIHTGQVDLKKGEVVKSGFIWKDEPQTTLALSKRFYITEHDDRWPDAVEISNANSTLGWTDREHIEPH